MGAYNSCRQTCVWEALFCEKKSNSPQILLIIAKRDNLKSPLVPVYDVPLLVNFESGRRCDEFIWTKL